MIYLNSGVKTKEIKEWGSYCIECKGPFQC